MKLLVVCRAYNNMAGGIERMAAALMNDMCMRGHDISLLTWDLADAQSFYDFNSKIQWYSLDLGAHQKKAGWGLRFKRMLKMRRILANAKPDIILAFQHGTFLATRVYTMGLGIPVIAAEREGPGRFDHLKAGKWRWLIYQSFRLASRITIQCESYRNNYPAYLHKSIVTIPNPVFPSQSFANPAGERGKRKKILSVGRLEYQKNQAALVDAFAQIQREFPDWDLFLVGEGEDRKALKKKIESLGLQNRISMPGAVKDMDAVYCSSHLFCLSARWEGFPNVIAESLSHGLPAVGFEKCCGVGELIASGVNGLLAAGNGDAGALARTLRILMADDDLRARMGKAGIESMRQYEPDKIFDRWESFLCTVSGL